MPRHDNRPPGTADVLVGASPVTANVPAGASPGTADVPVGASPATLVDASPGTPDVPVGAPNQTPTSRGWYTRGYLPHFDSHQVLQSVTFRLSDSLPQQTLRRLEGELRRLPESRRDAARRQKIEAWLDAGLGSCLLRHPQVAQHLQSSLLHFNNQRYLLHAWCIMPNHVHVLLHPITSLATIVQAWKSFTARWIVRNQALLDLQRPEGQTVWMREYWDRYIRDEQHYAKVVEYIHQNPVKAGLCKRPEDWPWSSAGV